MSLSLLALLDDITTVLDDVAVLTKVAAQKTVGVLGDDLALNAQQVHGVAADRELPVVWAVAKGSALNKAILVPLALAISAFAPWAVTPLLMVGGLFLCFEGFEKLAHKYLHKDSHKDSHQNSHNDSNQAVKDRQHKAGLAQALNAPAVDVASFEKDKIKGAIRTDFVLSAEIIAITLGTVASQPMLTQLGVLALVSAVMTVGVYGAVAGIVKLDDAGLFLSRSAGDSAWAQLKRRAGAGVLRAAPLLMRGLTIAGTVAMFLVGGGILTHGLPWAHHALQNWASQLANLTAQWPQLAAVLGWVTPPLGDAVAGLLAGGLVWSAVNLAKRSRGAAASA